MSLFFLRILLFLLFPIGAYLLFKSIKLVLKFANSEVLLRVPFLSMRSPFTIAKDGSYAIWKAGPRLSKYARDMKTPFVIDENTGETIHLDFVSSQVYVNSMTEGRIQMYTFYAKAGNYMLQMNEEIRNQEFIANNTKLQKKEKELAAMTIQVREYKSSVALVFGIISTIISFAIMLAGILLTVHADEVFH